MNALKAAKPWRLLREKNGSSIVEIMVGFVVLMVMLAMFSQIVALANQMLRDAKWMAEEQERFNSYFYSTSYNDRNNEVTVNSGGEETKLSFSLELDSSKTSVQNYANGNPLTSFALAEVELDVYESDAGIRTYFFRHTKEDEGA